MQTNKEVKCNDPCFKTCLHDYQIELISRLHHCHVVPLLGYCLEYHGKHAQRLLVFEYMPNGSLRDCLDAASGRCLDWATRVTIAFGAARGLEYLHEAAAPRILHRDVKSTNVLLDENWRAKVMLQISITKLRTRNAFLGGYSQTNFLNSFVPFCLSISQFLVSNLLST